MTFQEVQKVLEVLRSILVWFQWVSEAKSLQGVSKSFLRVLEVPRGLMRGSQGVPRHSRGLILRGASAISQGELRGVSDVLRRFQRVLERPQVLGGYLMISEAFQGSRGSLRRFSRSHFHSRGSQRRLSESQGYFRGP